MNYLIQNGDFFFQGSEIGAGGLAPGWGDKDEALAMSRPNAMTRCKWLADHGFPNAKVVEDVPKKPMRIRRAKRT